MPESVAPPPSPSEHAGEDWASAVAALLERLTGEVERRAVRPIETLGRGVVFGLLIAIVAPVVVTMLAVGVVRLLNETIFVGLDWASLFVVGGILAGAGVFLWTKRAPRSARTDS